MKENHLMIETHPAIHNIQFLKDQVLQFNVAQTDIDDGKPFAVFFRSKRGEIFAGVSGETWGGCCEIDYLWVHKDMRRRGYGSKLLLAVEREAVARGCRQVVLNTYSFQVPEFYRKFGYQVVCVLPDCPRHHQKYFLRKLFEEQDCHENNQGNFFELQGGCSTR